jgi:hypothetical protein
MRTLRLSSKGGLYNPQQIRTIECMVASVYSGKGSYKRIHNFNKINFQPQPQPEPQPEPQPQPQPEKIISEFEKILKFISKVTFLNNFKNI